MYSFLSHTGHVESPGGIIPDTLVNLPIRNPMRPDWRARTVQEALRHHCAPQHVDHKTCEKCGAKDAEEVGAAQPLRLLLIPYQDCHMLCLSSRGRPIFRTRITTCYMPFELRQALIPYQDNHMLLLTVAGTSTTPLSASAQSSAR